MSRTSLNKRLQAVRDVILPPGSLRYRIYHLPARERRYYEEWVAERSALIAAAGGPGRGYERYICGDLALPDMPEPVAALLNVEPERHSNKIPSEIYTAMLDEEHTR